MEHSVEILADFFKVLVLRLGIALKSCDLEQVINHLGFSSLWLALNI